jgi:hypothetical protein
MAPGMVAALSTGTAAISAKPPPPAANREPKRRSPALNPPAATSTVPATSQPGMRGSDAWLPRPRIIPTSQIPTPAAWVRTSTCPRSGTESGRSPIRTFSGTPNAS